MERNRAKQELAEFDTVFTALSHESRRRVLVVLLGRGGQMTAGEIVKRFQCSWPTMTRHLKVLEEASLISVDKLGRQRNYILNHKTLLRVVGGWLRWFEEGVKDESTKSRSRIV